MWLGRVLAGGELHGVAAGLFDVAVEAVGQCRARLVRVGAPQVAGGLPHCLFEPVRADARLGVGGEPGTVREGFGAQLVVQVG